MTIPLVVTSGNYDLWIGRTNQAIGVINLLTDGVLTVNGSIRFANALSYINIQNIYSNVISVNTALTISNIDIGSGLRAAFNQANTTQAALSGYQPSLGFTPVQQGGGISQGNSKVFIGWDSANAGILIQVDGTPFGPIATQAWAQPSLGFNPVQQGGGAGQGAYKLFLGWDGVSPRLQVNTTDIGRIALLADVNNAISFTQSAFIEANAAFVEAQAAFTKANTAQSLAAAAEPALGFTPVQQGGGSAQLGNKIYLGWDGAFPRLQVDNVDMGHILLANTSFSGVFPVAKFLGTTYTNTNGRAMFVSIIIEGDSFNNTAGQLKVNGNQVAYASMQASGSFAAFSTLYGIVPPGATFQCNSVGVGAITINTWTETY